MSNIFAEATVRITPSLTGFVSDLEDQLKTKMKAVKPPVIRVKPGLSPDFVGSLRKQVNAAILQAQKGVKPILIKALIEPVGVSNRAIPGGVGGGTGGGSGGGGRKQPVEKVVSEATRITQANKAITSATERLTAMENKLLTQTPGLARERARLNELIAAGKSADAAASAAAETTVTALKNQATALQLDIDKKIQDQAATVKLAESNKTLAASTGGVGAAAQRGARNPLPVRAASLTNSRGQIAQALVQLREADVATAKLGKSTKDLTAVQDIQSHRQNALNSLRGISTRQIVTADEATRASALGARKLAEDAVTASKRQAKALQDEGKAASTAARNSAQLSRGGQATLLSLAGIRGATLAASRSFLVGAATITVFAKAVQSFAALETNLNVFQTTARATANEMERVRAEAVKLGADLTLPGVSAGDAAGAMVELAKAGLSVQDSIAGARGVLQLATAAAIDNAAATQIVANAINAFGLAGADAVHVADAFANAADLAQGSIADIGTAFQQASAAGRQVGLSFQDTSVFLTILAKNGLRGADAGTSLRTALIRLVNPSKAAAKAFQQLGIEVRDAAGNVRPDVFLQIADATKRLSPAARDAAVALIGGQDAFRAITILGRGSIKEFIAMRRALREEGTAADLAAARNKGLQGALDGLGSVLQTVGTNVGASVGPALAKFTVGTSRAIDHLSQSTTVVNTLNDALRVVGQTLNATGQIAKNVSVVALPLAGALLKVTQGIGLPTILAGVVGYKLLGNSSERLGKSFNRLTKDQQLLVGGTKKALLSTAGLKQALTGAATSLNVYVLAAAATAAAIVFIVSRETTLERVTRHLTEAQKALSVSIGDVNEAASQKTIATHSVNAAAAAIIDAQKAAATARSDLANSKAAKGSVERRRAELALAIAIDNVSIAEQGYEDAQRASENASAAAEAASLRRADATKKELDALTGLAAVSRAQALLKGVQNRGGIKGGPGLADIAAVDLYVKKLRDLSNVQRRSVDENDHILAKRNTLLANFTAAVKRFPSVQEKQIIFDFNIPTTIAAAQKLEALLRQEGKKTAAGYVQALLLGMGLLPPKFKQLLDEDVRAAGVASFAQTGQAMGHALTDSIIAFFQSQKKFISDALSQLVKDATTDAARAATRLDIAAGSGASDKSLLGIARQQLAATNRRFTEAKRLLGRGESPSRRKAFEDAAAARAAAFSQVQGFTQSINADAKQAGEDAATKSNAATQAFIDAFSTQDQKLQNKLTKAGLIKDDLKRDNVLIAINKAIVARFKREIALLKERIRRLHLHGDALKTAKAAIVSITQQIFTTNNEIDQLKTDRTDAQKAKNQARTDRINERLDLRIQLAEAGVTDTNANTKALVAAHKAKLAQINAEIGRTKKNTIAWLKLKVAQQEEKKTINELTGAVKKTNEANAQMQFAFLQAQSGFVANLLGNLIPGGATGGLVGGTTGTGTGAPPLLPPGATNVVFPGDRGPGGPSGGLSKSPAEDLRKSTVTVAGGPTRGGQSTQNQRLLQIVHLLTKIYQGTGHPEAKHRQNRNIWTMDLGNNI